MLSNPDTALPLYLFVVVAGILLGGKWQAFAAVISNSGKAATTHTTTVTGGSSAATGGQHT